MITMMTAPRTGYWSIDTNCIGQLDSGHVNLNSNLEHALQLLDFPSWIQDQSSNEQPFCRPQEVEDGYKLTIINDQSTIMTHYSSYVELLLSVADQQIGHDCLLSWCIREQLSPLLRWNNRSWWQLHLCSSCYSNVIIGLWTIAIKNQHNSPWWTTTT